MRLILCAGIVIFMIILFIGIGANIQNDEVCSKPCRNIDLANTQHPP